LPQAGLFAAGIGLAVLSLHGGSMFNWMASEGAVTPAARAAFMKIVALDCALWAALMFVVWIATSLAYRWIWSNVSTASAVVSLSASSAESRRQPSIPTGGARPNGAKRDKVPAGWAALAVTTVIGVFVIWLTAGRNPVAPAQRGQTIAAVAAGLYFGAMIGRYFTGVQEARWYLLAVPAIGFLAALVSYFSADMSWAQGSLWQPYIHLATTPVHDLARPLPVEYIAVGTVAALIGFWSGDKAEQVALEVV
ncbi:MAG: hypothetical protein FWC56_00860, partial [Phycisphaerae bacterium]|nr:hypothetical protein [Phycisphaerae bacterium]